MHLRITTYLFLGAAVLLNLCTANAGATLSPGDIVYADSGNAIEGGFILKVDPTTGDRVVISSGGYLQQPFYPVLAADGAIIVSDTSGRIVRVDPATGSQVLIVDNSIANLGMPCGIALDGSGNVIVANAQAILRVHPLTGQTGVLSSGGKFLYPIGVTVSERGDIYVLNRAFPNQVIRVNPKNGGQTVLSVGGYLKAPQAITASRDDIFISDVATPDGNFGVGRIIRVDRRTGKQTIVSEGGYLICPVGVAVDELGQILVGDPYSANPASVEPYSGAIIRIDPLSGDQTLISWGHGGAVNPRGVAEVPSSGVVGGIGNGKALPRVR